MSRSRPVREPSSSGQGRRRLLLWGGVGAGTVVLVIAVGAWLGWTAQKARAELLAARQSLPAVRAAIMTGDGTGGARLDEVLRHAQAAEERTHDPVWSAVAALPWLGTPVATTRGMTRAVHDLAEHGMPPLVLAADTLHPAHLLSGDRLDVAALQKSGPALGEAAVALTSQRDAVALLEPSWLGTVADARAELLAELDSLTGASAAAADAAKLVPPMLGLNGPRRYFVAFQNPAEARASGGLLDAFAIVVADHGRVRVERIGANTQLPAFTGDVDADVDADYLERYGTIGATSAWLEANVSPHFPDVATSWEAMWEQATGQKVDGTVTLTPRALAAVLAATGPVQAPVVGSVDATRIEPLVLHEQYVMPALGDNGQRKSLMLGVGSATIDALLSGRASPAKLLPGLRSAAHEGHILIHSRTAAEQTQLEAAGIAGALDTSDRPFAQTVFLNAAGNKLDSWLSSTLDYKVTSCTPSGRTVQLTMTVRNDAPTTGLPTYVTVRSDAPSYPVKPSQNLSELEVLLTRGAKLKSATLDGAPMAMAPAEGTLPDTLPDLASTTFLHEATTRGRPSFWMDLELVPATPRTLVLTVTEPPSGAAPLLPQQVMVNPQKVRSEIGACSAAGLSS